MKTIITIISALTLLSSCKSSSFLNQRYTHFKHHNSAESATKVALSEKESFEKSYPPTEKKQTDLAELVNNGPAETQITTQAMQAIQTIPTKKIVSKSHEIKSTQLFNTKKTTVNQQNTQQSSVQTISKKPPVIITVLGTILITVLILIAITVFITFGYIALIIFVPFA